MSEVNPLPLVKRLRELAEEHHEMLGDIHVELSQAADIMAELYEALAAMADHFGPLEDADWMNEDCRHAFALSRAALAKARGEFAS